MSMKRNGPKAIPVIHKHRAPNIFTCIQQQLVNARVQTLSEPHIPINYLTWCYLELFGGLLPEASLGKCSKRLRGTARYILQTFSSQLVYTLPSLDPVKAFK
ncbi:uncharacterized protein TERG_12276 [Trichophyton rubrum CBS 118892]|uniref:Uncharacterized protein n=1 Tax=Trichophyton rubrum (strain ATCC MYA-4607 / CBS 118892) TaxID=559305 RepID=A0A080WUZ5_TRIRC|nr:uncharacterized protein TERG_12276 [Trichophyton rubrum CBS 118892]KFL61943.1 hypothetical protein TERG_12276 [Trichophyton rubrum CBS 118892]